MIEFEPNHIRKSHRLELPAQVVIDDRLHPVLNWSLQGFGLGPCPELDDTKVGDQLPLRFVLAFATFQTVISATGELTWRDDECCGFAFVALPAESRLLMREYVEASIEGRLDSGSGVLSAVQGNPVPAQIEKPLTPEQADEGRRLFRRHSWIHGGIGLAALLLASVLIYHQRFVYSVHGVLTGNEVSVAAPGPGLIEEIPVRQSSSVAAGDVLFRLDARERVAQLGMLKAIQEDKRRAAAAAQQRLAEELERRGLYTRVAEGRERMLASRMERVQAELRFARAERRRGDRLSSAGALGESGIEKREAEAERLEALARETEQELALARIVSEEAGEGRFFSGHRVENRVAELTEARDDRRADLRELDLQIRRLQADIDASTVRASRPAVVHSVNRQDGETVRAGDTVMTLQTLDRPWVAARFTFEDASRIAPGRNAVVTFPSSGISVAGTVEAIGHTALSSGGRVSQDLELSLSEVPVKIAFAAPPPGLTSGLRAQARVETPLRLPGISRLFEPEAEPDPPAPSPGA